MKRKSPPSHIATLISSGRPTGRPAEEPSCEELPSGAVESVEEAVREEETLQHFTREMQLQKETEALLKEAIGRPVESIEDLIKAACELALKGMSDEEIAERVAIVVRGKSFGPDSLGIAMVHLEKEFEELIQAVKKMPALKEDAREAIFACAVEEYIEQNHDNLFEDLFGRSLKDLFVEFVVEKRPRAGLLGSIGLKSKESVERSLEVPGHTLSRIKDLLLISMINQKDTGGRSGKSIAGNITALIRGARDPEIINRLGLENDGQAIDTPDKFSEVLTRFWPVCKDEVQKVFEQKLEEMEADILHKNALVYIANNSVGLLGNQLLLQIDPSSLTPCVVKRELEPLEDDGLVDLNPKVSVSKEGTNTPQEVQ